MTARGSDMTSRGWSASLVALSFLSVIDVKWATECPGCSEECED